MPHLIWFSHFAPKMTSGTHPWKSTLIFAWHSSHNHPQSERALAGTHHVPVWVGKLRHQSWIISQRDPHLSCGLSFLLSVWPRIWQRREYSFLWVQQHQEKQNTAKHWHFEVGILRLVGVQGFITGVVTYIIQSSSHQLPLDQAPVFLQAA